MDFNPAVLSQIPDYAPNPVAAQNDAYTLASKRQAYQGGQIDLQNAQQSQKDEAAAREILKGSDLSSFEGQTKAAQALTKVSPKLGMDFMSKVQGNQARDTELTSAKLQLAADQQDAIVGAIDPIVAQLQQEAKSGKEPALLDAKAKQLIIPALLQMRQNRPDLQQVIDRFQQDPNNLTFKGLLSADEQSKRGSAALKDRLAQQKQEETERHNLAAEGNAADRNRTAADKADPNKGVSPLSEKAQALKDELISRDPSFLSKSKVSAQQLNQTIENWARDGKSADDVIGGRLSTKGSAAEVASLSKQKASLERTEKSIVDTGGFLDQAEQAVKEVNLPKVQSLGKLENWSKESMSDPALANYHTAITELRAEYAIVLSKGGVVTEGAREEAKGAIPDYITPETFQRIKQRVQQGVAASSRAVDASLREASHESSTPAAGGGSGPPPSAASSPAGGGAPGWGQAKVVGGT
jgi:hypothetical protein